MGSVLHTLNLKLGFGSFSDLIKGYPLAFQDDKRSVSHCVAEWTCNILCDILGDAPHILDNIVRLKSDLSNITEPDFGLLDWILSLGVLTRRQYTKLRSGEKTTYERKDTFLDLLESEDQCDKFVKALERTEQKHVVNLITQNECQKFYDIQNSMSLKSDYRNHSSLLKMLYHHM